MLKLFSRKNKEGPWSVFISFVRRLLPSISREGLERPRAFLIALLGFAALLVVWGAFAEIDQVVRVEGKIIPAGRSQKIQHFEGGIVASINTFEGAPVKKGDLLLSIDNTMADANLSESQVKLNGQRVRAIRLEAETQSKDKLVYPKDLVDLPMAEAERKLFDARRARLSQEIFVHQNSIKQRTADIADAEQRHVRLSNELKTAQQRLTMSLDMAARGAASKMEVLDAQGREQRIKTEIGEAEGLIPKLKAAIAEEYSRIEAAKADFKAHAHDELVTTLAEIDRLKQNITAAADRLKRTEVRAPVDGIINRLSVNTVGGVVKPGENLIELIPNTEAVLIESKSRPQDRGYLRAGLESKIRISAYDVSSLGMLGGTVTEVSADSIQDSNGTPYYQVNILIKTLPPSYADHPIVPGMTVTADIVTGQRTVLSYLFSPLSKFTYNMFRDPR